MIRILGQSGDFKEVEEGMSVEYGSVMQCREHWEKAFFTLALQTSLRSTQAGRTNHHHDGHLAESQAFGVSQHSESGRLRSGAQQNGQEDPLTIAMELQWNHPEVAENTPFQVNPQAVRGVGGGRGGERRRWGEGGRWGKRGGGLPRNG